MPSNPSSPKTGASIQRRCAALGAELLKPRRRYSLDLSEPRDDPEPELLCAPEGRRRGSFRLVMDDASRGVQDHADEGDIPDMATAFTSAARQLPAAVGQTCVRMNDLMAMIRNHFHDHAAFLDGCNHQRLVDVAFMVATANYHLAKWINQIDRKSPPLGRPSRLADEAPPGDVLAHVQSAVSRMDVLSSKFTPILQKIVAEAKAMRRNCGEPLTPGFRNPARLAMKRGLLDVDELARLPPHLEHLLWAAGNLAHSTPKRAVARTALVMQAAGRFRHGLLKKTPQRHSTCEGLVRTPRALALPPAAAILEAEERPSASPRERECSGGQGECSGGAAPSTPGSQDAPACSSKSDEMPMP